ncbi:hypothetical protein G5V58_05795 [Nocardioides anomalus]|uniref:DUF4352 domain-containing protein n=1 Tax=Nocardioides anomalus TaxID=2712223 RepID=A0A6G6WB64_9ACTN|nr:hypothetical protein [Nocardioides anomalus]QIG42345.1 hypothetical protein G5V58_05795 [Nocardioides anomalus]
MRRVPGWLWAALVVVVALLLAVPLGGWDHVDRADASAQRLAPGQRHVSDPFATSVLSAEVTDRDPASSFDPEPGTRFLVVRARVDNRTDRTRDATGDLLVPAGVDLGPASTVTVARDPQSRSAAVQPGLPAEVLFAWELEGDTVAPGDTLRVQVVDWTEIESRVASGLVPTDYRVGAVVEVPVS